MILYHGTKKSNLPGILNSGLRAGFGWGADNPGVFLSKDPENALYWAKMSVEKSGDQHDTPVIIQVDVPEDAISNIIPRRTSFAKEGDVQFLGAIPSGWVSPYVQVRSEETRLLKKLVREFLKH
jgi:hypothetical protein